MHLLIRNIALAAVALTPSVPAYVAEAYNQTG